MAVIAFIIVLFATIQITNIKNSTKASEEILEFSRIDSLIIFICFLSSFLVEHISKNFSTNYYWYSIMASSFVYTMILMVSNKSREKLILNKKDQITKIYESLEKILGKIEKENIDFSNFPFEFEEDKDLHIVNKITLNTSLTSGKFNERTIIEAQYSINEFFPELQWTSLVDYPKRRLTFKGLPKPPKIAMYPGSDYRPTTWIPLGLNGKGEIGWVLTDTDDLGVSSYKLENEDTPKSVNMPSAPQCLTLGSTGGGKAIYCNQKIDIIN